MNNIIMMEDCTDIIYKSRHVKSMYHGSKKLYQRQLTETTLMNGDKIASVVNKSMMQFLRSSSYPSVAATDISEAQDGSVLTWYSGSTQYWWSDADIIYLNDDARHMFSSCANLTSIDLRAFDSSKTSRLLGLFMNNTKLASVDISTWDVANPIQKDIDMRYMFSGCTNLGTISYGPGFAMTSEHFEYISYYYQSSNNPTFRMFYTCPANKPTGGYWSRGRWDGYGTFETK